MEFKVGDKLKCIALPTSSLGMWYTIDSLYEIVVAEGDNFSLTCDSNGKISNVTRVFIANFFQHIDEPQPQVTKVKLTQEQARALENVMKDNDIECVITAHAEPGKWILDEKRALNELSVADLARALLIGYEVEQTAEEKVLSELQAAFDDEDYGEVEYTCYTDGVRMVLDAYGITVKGINDND